MKKLKKNLYLKSLCFLLLLFTMSFGITKITKATTSLTNIELNLSSPGKYINQDIPVKGKTFSIFFDEKNKSYNFLLKEGSSSKLLLPENFSFSYGFIYLLGETSNSLYYSVGSDIYIVDKNTCKVQKQSAELFIQPFKNAAKLKNLTTDGVDFFFNSGELTWIVVPNGTNSRLLIHKDGLVKELQGDVQTYIIPEIDSKGTFYYFDADKVQLVSIDTAGREIRYQLPTEVKLEKGDYLQGFFIDNEDRLYIHANNNLTITKIDSNKLKVIKKIDNILNVYRQRANNLISYSKSSPWGSSVISFLDNSLNSKDKYFLYDVNLAGFSDKFSVSIYDEDNLRISEENSPYYYASVLNGKLTIPNKLGWMKKGDYWCYIENNGLRKKGWLLDHDTWYYLYSNGIMATGWITDGGKSYFLNPNGSMATGWTLINNKWYYMSSSGSMVTGWVLVGNNWYYMNRNGEMATGWINVNRKWYYMYSDGSMAVDTIINGCKIGKDGVWIP